MSKNEKNPSSPRIVYNLRLFSRFHELLAIGTFCLPMGKQSVNDYVKHTKGATGKNGDLTPYGRMHAAIKEQGAHAKVTPTKHANRADALSKLRQTVGFAVPILNERCVNPQDSDAERFW